jgi:hypothetical protein
MGTVTPIRTGGVYPASGSRAAGLPRMTAWPTE